MPLDRDSEGGFDRSVAALGPARDVGVGVHRSRIRLLGEGGQDADRVADADMESPAELGDRSVEGLRSGEERSAPVGPRSVEQRRFDHQRGDDLVVGFGGGGPGGIVLEAEVATEPDDGGGHRFDYERSAACGCSPPKWIVMTLAVSWLETIACGKVTRSSDQRRVPGRGV